MARYEYIDSNKDEAIGLICDGCGLHHEVLDLTLDKPAEADLIEAQLPNGWRADSRYEYCPKCAPARIPRYENFFDTPEELQAAATKAASGKRAEVAEAGPEPDRSR